MKVVRLVLVLLILLAVSPSGYAVVPYSEDFNYDFGTDPGVLEWDVDSGDPYFNGSGQWVMEGTGDGMNRGVGGGHFVMEVEWSSVNMAPEGQDWSVFHYSFEHNGAEDQWFDVNLDSWWDEGENTSIYIDAYSSTEGGNVYDEYIGALSSMTLKIEWSEASDEYSLYRSVNGGAMSLMVTIGGYDASSESRVESFWADSHTEALSVEFDNYNMVPEPVTILLLGLGGLGLIHRKRR
jgi:hypothetical protein